MGDISIKGSNKSILKGAKDLVTAPYRGIKKVVQGAKDLITAPSKRIKKFGGGRTNLLEQLGRVEAEPSNPNRRAEISRVHGELNRGYAKGGRAGFVHGSVAKVAKIAARKFRKPKPHRDKPPSKTHKDVPTIAAEGGRIGLKKGGSDKKWIQKAVDPKHKGYCTPMTKKTCTPARKALARTFKKKAKTGWG